jgi:hypothetical protein
VARPLAAIVSVVNPELIVLGGGIVPRAGLRREVGARLAQLSPVRLNRRRPPG